MRAPPAPVLANKITPPPRPTIYLKEADPALKFSVAEKLKVKVGRRFFHTDNASRWVEAGGLQFLFLAYNNIAGSWRGVYATETTAEIVVLASLTNDPASGITEINEDQFNLKYKDVTNLRIPAPNRPASVIAQWAEDLEALIKAGYEFSVADNSRRDYPSITTQTPWSSGVLSLPITKDLVYYNSGLAEIGGKLVCVARRWTRQAPTIWNSHLEAVELNGNMEILGRTELRMLNQHRAIQYEDPRVAVGPNGDPFVSYCTWKFGTRYVARQGVAVLDTKFNAVSEWYPSYGHNGTDRGHEKNWLWFWDHGQWHLVYSFQPHVVVEMGTEFTSRVPHKTLLRAVPWACGQIRGGSNPVKKGGHYYSFFHSSLPWEGRRKRYYMGAYAFQSHPPFSITHMTPEPILAGSRHNTNILGGPLVVFPCGAVMRDNQWIVTGGLNDEATFWIKIPHKELMAKMVEVE